MPNKWDQYAEQPATDKWSKYAVAETPVAGAGSYGVPKLEAHPVANLQPAAETFGSRYVHRLGENASGLINPLLHPIDSILKNPGFSDPSQMGDVISTIRENPNKLGVANALADATVAGGIGAAAHLSPLAAEPLGENLKASGGKMIDRTVGLLKKDVARGAQPGRAYLEGGGGPALSMRGLAESAGRIQDETGAKLGDAYQNAGASGINIPASDVYNAVSEPINKLKSLSTGAGGTGAPAALSEYEANTLKPVFAANARGGFTPSELFSEMKKPIAKNTRWNDPTMYDLNNVRQETVGRLGSLLTDAVPETAEMNKIYQGTGNLAGRATMRADTGQSPLSAITRRGIEGAAGAALGYATNHPLLGMIPIAADTVPVRSTVASGLFQGGKALPLIGSGLQSVAPLSAIAGRGRREPRPKNDERDQQ